MERIDIDDARNRLDELIARARAGEEVVITKNGAPAATLAAVTVEGRGTGPTASETSQQETEDPFVRWWRATERDRPRLRDGADDAATLIRRLRDEGH